MSTTMWYNISAINPTDPLSLVQNIDSLFMFHFFGVLILATIFVIIFRAFVEYNNNPKVSFMYTTFFIAVLGTGFRLLSLVNDQTVFIVWGTFALSLALQPLLD